MAAEKAIMITEDNIKTLHNRFCEGEYEFTPLATGYFLVAKFDSQDGDYDLLDVDNFKAIFKFTGKSLRNGFMEVVRRA